MTQHSLSVYKGYKACLSVKPLVQYSQKNNVISHISYNNYAHDDVAYITYIMMLATFLFSTHPIVSN